jgi:hypothetical protein
LLFSSQTLSQPSRLSSKNQNILKTDQPTERND